MFFFFLQAREHGKIVWSSFSPCKYWNQITETQSLASLYLHHFASGRSSEVPCVWLTRKTMVSFRCGVSQPVEVLKSLKFEVGMVTSFPCSNIFYIQALYEYKKHVYWQIILCVSMRLECNIIECLHLYENVKVHIRRLANQLHLVAPWKWTSATVKLSSAWFCLRGVFNKWNTVCVIWW